MLITIYTHSYRKKTAVSNQIDGGVLRRENVDIKRNDNIVKATVEIAGQENSDYKVCVIIVNESKPLFLTVPADSVRKVKTKSIFISKAWGEGHYI